MIRVRDFNNSFPRWPRILRLLGIIVVFLVAFGALIHFAEPKTFITIFDGIWWAIVTMSTIGYGDLTPVSNIGRIIALFLIFSGIGLITAYFSSVSAMAASSVQLIQEGRAPFYGHGHLIIVGWNERSRGIIEIMHSRKQDMQIVLIDESLSDHPLPRMNIHFVKGKATLDTILQQANIEKASRALITADLRQDEFQTDMFSILTLLAIKGLNPTLNCLVEVLTKEQKGNAWRAGADEIIETNKFASEFMLNCLQDKADFKKNGENIVEWNGIEVVIRSIPIEKSWKNRTYKEVVLILVEQDTLIIGINRGGNNMVKPPQNTVLYQDDQLLILE